LKAPNRPQKEYQKLRHSPGRSARPKPAGRAPAIAAMVVMPVSSPYRRRLRRYHQPAMAATASRSSTPRASQVCHERARQAEKVTARAATGNSSAPDTLVRQARPSRAPSSRVCRPRRPGWSDCTSRTISPSAAVLSSINRVSLLTDAPMNSTMGLKATKAAASRPMAGVRG
jgi:hypothetical protein